MKTRFYQLLTALMLVLLQAPSLYAQTFQISGGTSSSYLYNLAYTFYSAPRTQRLATHIPAAQLAAGGLVPGAVITSLELEVAATNTVSLATGANIKIYLENRPATSLDLGTGAMAWNVTTATQIYDGDPSPVLGNSGGWKSFAFGAGGTSATFTYTGGAIVVYSDYIHTTAIGGTTSLNMMYATAAQGTPAPSGWTTNSTKYSTSSTTTPATSMSSSTANHPHLRLNFNTGPCTNPPTTGTTTITPSGSICANTSVSLNLSGNSTGSGLTFEWEESTTGTGSWVSTAPPQSMPLLITTPGTTKWYRCKVICSGGTPVYSNPVQVTVPAPLNGVYTINNANPTAGTNFNSFTAAIDKLNCAGVSGPVTFNVSPGTPYVETLNFSTIAGVSSTNTVRFNGNGALVQFTNTTSERQLLTLDGTQYVRIDSLTFKSLDATFGWGARIAGGAAYDSITRCQFDLSSVTSTTAANVNGILFTGSATATTTAGVNGTHIYIANNHIKGSAGAGGLNYGIGIASGGSDSNIIRNNVIENFYNNGIYIATAKATIIEGNEIHKATKTAGIVAGEGIYTASGDMSGSKIIGNRIHSPGGTVGGTTVFQGIALLGDGTAANPVLVANNVIYNINQGGASSGIYVSTGIYNLIYHNTITFDQVLGGTAIIYGIYTTGANTGTKISNNLVSITEGTGGIKYGFYYVTANGINDAQKNNFYLNSAQAGTQNYGYYTTAYATQAAFQTAYPALETGSPTSDPQFSSAINGDFSPMGSGVINAGINVLSEVPNDILGLPRSATPTIGAFEFVPSGNNDAMANGFLSPSGSYCANTNTPVEVIIGNGGSNTINTMQVNWSVNGTLMPPYSYTGPLVSPSVTGQSIDTVIIGTTTLPAGSVTIRVWTSLPNGQNDPNHTNDTIVFNANAALAPNTYTINSAAPTGGLNFNSFTDFSAALNAGICGPIVANVVAGSGPYTEQVTFGNISGASPTNTIKINGNGNVVQFNTATGNTLPLLQLLGTKHLKIDKLNFKTLSTTAAWAAWITAGAEHDSITNCSFDLSTVTATASTSNVGIALSGLNTSATGAGASGKHIAILGNHLLGSAGAGGMYYAVSLNAEADSNYIGNNIIENYYYYGVYLGANTGNSIIGNEIKRPNKTTGFTTNYCIYLASGTASQGHRIERNRIHSNTAPNVNNTSSVYGIGILADPPATNPIIVANNVIYNMKGALLYGLYASTAPNIKFYHNTISLNLPTGSASTNYGMYATGTNTGTEFINNNVSITAGGTGLKYGFYYSTAPSVGDAQKNNIHLNSSSPGSQIYGYYTTNYATQAAFQTAYPALEVGSPTVDPQFVSIASGDLAAVNPAVLTAGNNLLAVVPTDINGANRSANPTLGAYEYVVSGINNARSLTFLKPTGNYCSGAIPVELMIGNSGTNNINTLQINWTVNGILQTPVNYTSTLVPVGSATGQSFDTVSLGNANLNPGNNQIVAWTSLPNGAPDSQPANDTAKTVAVPTTFTVTASIDTICANQTSIVSLTPASGYAEGALAWEYSTNGTSWQTIPNSDTVNYGVTNIGTPTQYRARILTGGNNCVSPAVTIEVNYVAPPTVVPDESCEPASLTVSATPSAGNTLRWYEDLSTTTVLSTNSSVTSPMLYTTKTYYAVSVSPTGCQSVRTPVNATIHILPPVDLGNDLDTCTLSAASFNLDPGTQHPGATYLWDDNSTGTTRSITQSGTYHVTVTDTNSCFKSDTITVMINPRPVIDLDANGITFCTGATKILDAGPDGENGGEYYWNNGVQTRTLTVTTSGTYSVFVTTPLGCSGTDTVTLTEGGQAPTTNGINSIALNVNTFSFAAINPQNVASYEWDFGDGGSSTDPNPQHTFLASGNYLVFLKTTSSCAELIDSAYVNIIGVGIEETAVLSKLSVYPNPNYSGILNIDAGNNITIKQASLINVLGQTVTTESNFVQGQSIQQMNLPEQLSSGIYTLRIETDKGTTTRKIEIRK